MREEFFGYPAEVEFDLVIKNGVHKLVEIKTCASIAIWLNCGELEASTQR
jgi:hypothetical protein